MAWYLGFTCSVEKNTHRLPKWENTGFHRSPIQMVETFMVYKYLINDSCVYIHTHILYYHIRIRISMLLAAAAVNFTY